MQELSELQILLKTFLKKNQRGVQVLAEELHTAPGTITRWANGVSHPYPQVTERIIAILKSKIQIEQ